MYRLGFEDRLMECCVEVVRGGKRDRGRDGWIEGWMDERMDGWMEGWMDGWKDGWMKGWMEGWIDERMEGWIGMGGVEILRKH